MHVPLNHLVAQQHVADLHRAAERARLANAAGAARHTAHAHGPAARAGARLARLVARITPAGT